MRIRIILRIQFNGVQCRCLEYIATIAQCNVPCYDDRKHIELHTRYPYMKMRIIFGANSRYYNETPCIKRNFPDKTNIASYINESRTM
jgi:hypothetical protein